MDDNRHFFVPFIVMSVASIISAMLLVTALVIWLSSVTGSVIYTCLIVGALLAISAIAVYFCYIHQTLQYIHEKVLTIYEVSRYAKTCYEWVIERLCKLING